MVTIDPNAVVVVQQPTNPSMVVALVPGIISDESVAALVAPGTKTRTALDATFVRFVDQNGDPLPAGSVTTIHVNTVTGDIDDITFKGV